MKIGIEKPITCLYGLSSLMLISNWVWECGIPLYMVIWCLLHGRFLFDTLRFCGVTVGRGS